jgi:hypothetical protein
VGLAPGAHLGLPEARVRLDLVHRGRHARLAHQALQVLHQKVGDADLAHGALFPQVREGAPGLHVAVARGARPVDEVEVHHIEPQVLAGRLERAKRLVVALVAVAELCGHKHLARHAGRAQGVAHLLLVKVGRGAVDVAISQLKGLLYGPLRVLARNLERPETHLRDHRPVCQPDALHGPSFHVALTSPR